MCTKKGDQVPMASSLGGDVKVKLNQNQTITGTTNLLSSDSHSVDLRIHTNIKLISNRKIKICLLINALFTIVFITVSFVIFSKLYSELLKVQNQIITLNAKFASLSDACEQVGVETEPSISAYDTPIREAQVQDLAEQKGIEDGNYVFMLTDSPDMNLNRLRRANRRKKKRKVKSSGALSAHFKGSLPEIYIKDQGLIGPWYLDHSVSKQYKFPKFHLTEEKCSIEVTEPALYLIYAQVYYLTSSALNSYSVYVRSEGSSENNTIAKCSATGPNNSHVAEISCYTASVYSLKANDRIFIQQTERNRTIIMRDGYSFFGIVRLNNAHHLHKRA